MTTAIDQSDPAALLEDDLDFYASYVRQVTDDGDAIVDCLISIMEDEAVGAKPHERLDAQLLLDSIGFGHIAQAHAQRSQDQPPAAQAATPLAPVAPATQRRLRRPSIILSEEMLFALPPLVRLKTDRGRKMADFLLKAVSGQLDDFRPHHRLRAVKQLAPRGFAKSREPRPDHVDISVGHAQTLISSLIASIEERRRLAAETPSTQPETTGGSDDLSQPSQPPDADVFAHFTSGTDQAYFYPCSEPGHIYGCPCADYKDDELTLKMDELERQLDLLWTADIADNPPDLPTSEESADAPPAPDQPP